MSTFRAHPEKDQRRVFLLIANRTLANFELEQLFWKSASTSYVGEKERSSFEFAGNFEDHAEPTAR